jgi:hypothetical protein
MVTNVQTAMWRRREESRRDMRNEVCAGHFIHHILAVSDQTQTRSSHKNREDSNADSQAYIHKKG